MANVKIRMYCCGGLGMNLGSDQFQTDLNPCYIDASRANLHSGIDSEHCVIVDGVDGSGGHRRHNYAKIAKEIDPFISFFEPGVFNIVLFAAGGGYN